MQVGNYYPSHNAAQPQTNSPDNDFLRNPVTNLIIRSQHAHFEAKNEFSVPAAPSHESFD